MIAAVGYDGTKRAPDYKAAFALMDAIRKHLGEMDIVATAMETTTRTRRECLPQGARFHVGQTVNDGWSFQHAIRHRWRQRATLSRTHVARRDGGGTDLDILAVEAPVVAMRVRMGSFLSISTQVQLTAPPGSVLHTSDRSLRCPIRRHVVRRMFTLGLAAI